MKKANPKAVGGFVLGAILLAVIAVIVFGSGRLFQNRALGVAFFSDSLQGLRVGAPVQFRGVEVGTVKDIYVQLNPDSLDFVIPVIFEINLDHIKGLREAAEEGPSRLNELIKMGLRAQLDPQSLVTGQKAVQLIFSPDTPVNLVKTELPYKQIPTIPSRIAQMEQSIGSVLQDISDVLNQLKDLFDPNKPQISQVLTNIKDSTSDMKATMSDMRKAASDISKISSGIEQRREDILAIIDTTNETLEAYNSLAERMDSILSQNEQGLAEGIAGLAEVEQKVSSLADSANALLDENRRGIQDFTSDGLYEIRNLAVDAQATVEQFRRVLEEMERDPARFFLGKPGQVEVE